MEKKQTCNFVTKNFVKKSPDEEEKIESDDEPGEDQENVLVLPDEKTIEEINREFDELDTEQQKFVYAFLMKAREEFYKHRFPLASKLNYVLWIVWIELQYDTNWEALKEIIGKRKIPIFAPKIIGEISKQNFICIIRYKFKGKVLGEYKNSKIGVNCICVEGHACNPSLHSITKGNGICKVCAKCDPKTSKERFYNIIENVIGGKIIGQYKNNNTHIDCICPHGHKCCPLPASVLGGRGMCKICAKNDPETAKRQFYKNIEKMGGKVLGEYLRSLDKVKCECPNGHICYPKPNNISMGHYMCRICIELQVRSKGETMLLESLNKINIGPVLDGYAPKTIRRHKSNGKHLKYDATIITDKMTYYYEFHGEQHESRNRKFHKTEEKFLAGRQRDLVKIYVVQQDPKAKLIVLDYSWIKKPIEEWVEYLKKATKSKEKIIAESPLHGWIHNEKPTQESLDKYIVSE